MRLSVAALLRKSRKTERGAKPFPTGMVVRAAPFALLILTAVFLPGRDYGPPLGARMPQFDLPDQDGKMHSLNSLAGGKGAVILVYRSADWCPYCKAQLMELERHYSDFGKLGLGVAAISYDSTAVLHNFAERKGIHFPLLSDPNSKIIRELGILNETVPTDSPQFGIPYPGWFVVDAKGVITAKYFETDYHQRYTSAGILLHEFGLLPPAENPPVEGKQLTLNATASNAVVAPGQTVVLALDIELKPKMHVYAPGVEGYIPIDWTMGESDLAAARKTTFPIPQKLRLEAINETVPAYSGHFRLTRDVSIAQADKLQPALNSAGEFVLQGKLRYQACDDRICYIPQEMPILWVFKYQDLDRERVPVELQRKANASK